MYFNGAFGLCIAIKIQGMVKRTTFIAADL